jgi:hypothetical protein
MRPKLQRCLEIHGSCSQYFDIEGRFWTPLVKEKTPFYSCSITSPEQCQNLDDVH